jgi:Flp pilus assembly CpaF family ATPase
MEELKTRYYTRLTHVDTDFVRSIMQTINWKAILIRIKGAKGEGKTTLLLQYLKLHFHEKIEDTLNLANLNKYDLY